MTTKKPEGSFHDDPDINALAVEILAELPTLIRRMLGDALGRFVSPEDIAQDVAVECCSVLPEFKPRTDDSERELRMKFNAIARYRVLGLTRTFDRFTTAVESDVFEYAKQDGRSPSRIAGKKQALNAVQDCMSKLDETARKVLWLKVTQNMGFAAIAERLGMSVHQVSRLYHKAIEQMEQMLGSAQSHQFASSHG